MFDLECTAELGDVIMFLEFGSVALDVFAFPRVWDQFQGLKGFASKSLHESVEVSFSNNCCAHGGGKVLASSFHIDQMDGNASIAVSIDMVLESLFKLILVGMTGVLGRNMKGNPAVGLEQLGELQVTVSFQDVLFEMRTISEEAKRWLKNICGNIAHPNCTLSVFRWTSPSIGSDV